MVLLMVMMLQDPVFGLQRERLPGLKKSEGTAAGGTARASTLEAWLKLDGSATWKGEVVPREALADRVAAGTRPGETVTLVVETDAGKGMVEAFIQFQIDCGRLGVWDRVHVLYRPRDSGPAGEGQPK